MDKFEAMQIFVRVVEKGSFSAVAKERGIGQPAVSKQISALENELGTELIHRTSRSIALTDPGRDFYESALHILDDLENATSRIGRGQTAPKGLIRVTVPPTFARLHMVSKLAAFFAAYPDMAVEMAASESPTTIIAMKEMRPDPALGEQLLRAGLRDAEVARRCQVSREAARLCKTRAAINLHRNSSTLKSHGTLRRLQSS